MTCCSSEDLARYEDDVPTAPTIYTCPDRYLDEGNDIHKSYSEITKIPILDI